MQAHELEVLTKKTASMLWTEDLDAFSAELEVRYTKSSWARLQRIKKVRFMFTFSAELEVRHTSLAFSLSLPPKKKKLLLTTFLAACCNNIFLVTAKVISGHWYDYETASEVSVMMQFVLLILMLLDFKANGLYKLRRYYIFPHRYIGGNYIVKNRYISLYAGTQFQLQSMRPQLTSEVCRAVLIPSNLPEELVL